MPTVCLILRKSPHGETFSIRQEWRELPGFSVVMSPQGKCFLQEVFEMEVARVTAGLLEVEEEELFSAKAAEKEEKEVGKTCSVGRKRLH